MNTRGRIVNRFSHSVFYNELNGELIVFGGDFGINTLPSSIWSFSPATGWKELTFGNGWLLTRSGSAAIYYPAMKQGFVFGGWNPGSVNSDTILWSSDRRRLSRIVMR